MKLSTEVGLGSGHIVLDGEPAPPPKKGDTASQFSAHACCGKTAGWIKMPLGMEIGLGPGNIVLDGDPASPKGIQPHNFRPMSIVAKRLDDQDAPLGTEVDLGPGHIVLNGDSAPPSPRKGYNPLFSAYVYCGQTVAHLSYC